jgi:hypothetical protein
VRAEAAAGATLDEAKLRVTEALAPAYEKALSGTENYRPWRERVLGNIEPTYAMVSRNLGGA